MTERFLTAATVDHILKNPCPEAEERGKQKSYYQTYKGAPIPKPPRKENANGDILQNNESGT